MKFREVPRFIGIVLLIVGLTLGGVYLLQRNTDENTRVTRQNLDRLIDRIEGVIQESAVEGRRERRRIKEQLSTVLQAIRALAEALGVDSSELPDTITEPRGPPADGSGPDNPSGNGPTSRPSSPPSRSPRPTRSPPPTTDPPLIPEVCITAGDLLDRCV